jgi:hypothetical protein
MVNFCDPYGDGSNFEDANAPACKVEAGTLEVDPVGPPSVSNVDPTTIKPGTQGSITITGQNFAGADAQFGGTGVTRTGIAVGGGMTILTYSVDPGASPGPRTITITTQAGSTPTSVTVELPPIAIKLELVSTTISTDGKYSEDSTIRVTAVNVSIRAPVTGFTGAVNLAEDGTAIYTQNWPNGGTGLPALVTISSGGTATFVAKSLAGPKTEGQNGAKPDPALITATNYPVDGSTSLSIPQLDNLRSADRFSFKRRRIRLAPIKGQGSLYEHDGSEHENRFRQDLQLQNERCPQRLRSDNPVRRHIDGGN